MRALLLSWLVVAAPSFAQVYESSLLVKVCFSHPSFCPEGQADLVATDRTLTARYGVRLERGHRPAAATAAVQLDDAFIVNDRRGEAYRVWVRPAPVNRVRLEVEPLAAQNGAAAMHFTGGVIDIDGHRTKVALGNLTLYPSGRYFMKAGSGSFTARDHVLGFDGAIAHWGTARLADDGSALHFSFERGGLRWDISYRRDEADLARDTPVQVSARP